MEALWLIIVLFITITFGFPVSFTLAGISIIFAYIFLDIQFLYLLPLRVYGIMTNYVLIAVPLFVYMGITLEKSGIAERLLHTMSNLMGRTRGGLAISVVLVGSILAASTGIVGATIVTMGILTLPTMLKMNYSPSFSTGIIASSGTLGQIIPPSIVLVLLGSTMKHQHR